VFHAGLGLGSDDAAQLSVQIGRVGLSAQDLPDRIGHRALPDHQHSVPLPQLGEAHHLGRVTEGVYGHDGRGAGRERLGHRVRVYAEGLGVDVHEHRPRAGEEHRLRRFGCAVGRHDHFVARPYARPGQLTPQLIRCSPHELHGAHAT
jgi:hypothetical protein